MLMGLSAYAAACSAGGREPNDNAEPTSAKTQAMTGQSCGTDPAFRAVGALVKKAGEIDTMYCTATRIGYGVFLTAAHCTCGGVVNAPGCDVCGGEFMGNDGSSANLELGKRVRIGPFSQNDDSMSDVELCFGKELTYPLSKLAVASLPNSPQPDYLSSGVTMVGFGQQWDGSACTDPGTCRFRETSAGSDFPGHVVVQFGDGEGDSGGPIFQGHVAGSQTKPVVIAVMSQLLREDWNKTTCMGPATLCTSLPYSSNSQSALDLIRAAMAAEDPDGDGVYGPSDVCPGPDDKLDTDGDGVPDGCDYCPWDTDRDLDHVCDKVDNCNVFNPGQENSNAVFEAELGKPALGDACDTTPVATPIPGSTGLVFGPNVAECSAPGAPGKVGLLACAARRNSYDMSLWTTAESTYGGPLQAHTAFRYCICRNVDGAPFPNVHACGNLGCPISNLEFNKQPSTLPGDTRWLPITVYKGAPQFSGSELTGQPWDEQQGEEVQFLAQGQKSCQGFAPDDPANNHFGLATWNWPHDAPIWKAQGFWSDISTPPAGDFPDGPDIGGWLWTHDDSAQGSGSSNCVDGSTIAPYCMMGNSYQPWNPSARTYACPMPIHPLGPNPSGISTYVATTSGAQIRWQPEQSFTLSLPLVSQYELSTLSALNPVAVGASIVHAGFAVPCGQAGDDIARISLAGQVPLVVSEAFSNQLRQLLREPGDLIWVAPSGPVEQIGLGQFPLAVAVGASDGAVKWAVRPAPDGTMVPYQPSCRDCQPPSEQGAMLSAVIATPPAALGATAYSALTGRLVQLSGTDPNGTLDQVAISTVGSPDAEIRPLQPGARRPWSTRAAALSDLNDQLWVVSDVPEPHGAPARLYLQMIDPRSGVIEDQQRLMAGLSRTWLVTTAQGEAVLVAAKPNAPWYLVAVVGTTGPSDKLRLRLLGVALRQGDVIGAPQVSSDSVVVPIVDHVVSKHPKDPLNPANVRADVVSLDDIRSRSQTPCFENGSAP